MSETIESLREIKEDAIRKFLKTDFNIGEIRQPYETGHGIEYGDPKYYIKIGGMSFLISKDSFDLILNKITLIREVAGLKGKE